MYKPVLSLSNPQAVSKALTPGPHQVEALKEVSVEDLESLNKFVDGQATDRQSIRPPASTEPILKTMAGLVSPQDPTALRKAARQSLLRLHPDKIKDSSLISSRKSALAFQILKATSDLIDNKSPPKTAPLDFSDFEDLSAHFEPRQPRSQEEIERRQAATAKVLASRCGVAEKWCQQIDNIIDDSAAAAALKTRLKSINGANKIMVERCLQNQKKFEAYPILTRISNDEKYFRDIISRWSSRKIQDKNHELQYADILCRSIDASRLLFRGLATLSITPESLAELNLSVANSIAGAKIIFSAKQTAEGLGIWLEQTRPSQKKLSRSEKSSLKSETKKTLFQIQKFFCIGSIGKALPAGSILSLSPQNVVASFVQQAGLGLQKLWEPATPQAVEAALRQIHRTHFDGVNEQAAHIVAKVLYQDEVAP